MKRITCLLFLSSIALLRGGEIDYHADVTPILRDYCGGCHNESDYEGDFSIETFQALMEGGESEKPMITPGNVAGSFFASTILRTEKPAMPPRKEPQLSEEQVAVLINWIKQGAKGPAPANDHSILATLNVPDIKPGGTAAEPVTAGAYSPDGSIVAIGRYGRVEINDKVIPVDGKVNAVHFSPDGERLIVATGITGLRGIARVYEVDSGKEILHVGEDSHRDILYDAEFSPDGETIATAGYDRTIQIWNAKTGKFLHKIEGHNGAVFDIAFSPDSTLIASASADETGKIWQVADGERLDTLNQPKGEQFRIAFTPDGKFIVATGGDNKIRLWRLLSRTHPRINPVIQARFAHEEAVNEMALSRDGKWLATASADRSIKIWSLPGLQQVQMFGDQPDLVSVLAFGPGNRLLAGRMDGSTAPCSLDDLTGSSPGQTGYSLGPNWVQSQKRMAETKKFTEGDAEVLPVEWPARITGKISEPSDTDDFLFSAKKGERVVIEVNAARSKSELDSRVEVLTAEGEKIERVVLQAVRDSWFTFRGKDSNTSDDFRVHSWEEMELNEYLYANGEVVKLWHYPRGPDSGFRVYPGFGNRRTYFDTTPLSHPLGGPCYTVVAYPPGMEPSPNGLPVFRLFWENDDDGERILGSDSRLTFTAPETASYRVRISDVRGFGGENFAYTLTLRPPAPDFKVTHNGANLKISPGSGNEIEFVATHIDGFNGEIGIRIANLPAGFTAREVTIEAEQRRAYLAVHAEENAVTPSAEELKEITIVATGSIDGKPVTRTLPGFTGLGLSKPPKMKVDISPDGENGKRGEDGVLELSVPAGETVSALVKADRQGYNGIINFGKDESGRNLPHGVYVDNIGLSGLMIPAGQKEQRFWITAAKWVPGTERMFHLRAREAGVQVTKPVRIRVVK